MFELGIGVALASHWLTAGALGTVILGMIARVSLGHSGQSMEIGKPIVLAFVLIVLAALITQPAADAGSRHSTLAYHASGLLWVLAFGLFTLNYWPILTRPRVGMGCLVLTFSLTERQLAYAGFLVTD
ncbi:NnrS family protein [Zobellella aerophila]|uniref:Uncharacterized protein n=1 Tax=Zobellella aerophila TaxID=870480 RepID=A0ABP6W8Y2_9GAMM